MLSSTRISRVGTPQGSIISPALFNFYIADIPIPAHPLRLVSYADDITVYGTGNIQEVVDAINTYLPVLRDHLDALHLKVAPAKSTATLFTTWNKEQSAAEALVNIHIHNIPIPVIPTPKILGVTWDPQLRFGPHAAATRAKVIDRTNILKALTSTKWGMQKEPLMQTYNALGKSVLSYAPPVWSPNLAPSHFNKLQTAQNKALRVALGCHHNAAEDHLHAEAAVMKVEPHCRMLSAQYLASCFDRLHPCHDLSQPPDQVNFPRAIRQTITTLHREQVARLVVPGQDGEPDHRTARNRLHRMAVEAEIAAQAANRVLGAPAPPPL